MADKKPKKSPAFDAEAFKRGIAAVESGGGKYLWNKTSSATGKYQFLYNEIKDLPIMKGVSRKDFMNNPELQEVIMDMAINDQIQNRPGYYRNANDLTRAYKPLFGDKWNYRPDEIAAISHFLGRGGARKFLRAQATGGKYSVPGKNLEVAEYLRKYNEALGNIQEESVAKVSPAAEVTPNVSERKLSGITQDNLRPTNFYKKPKTDVEMNYNVSAPVANRQARRVQAQKSKPKKQTTSTTDWLQQYIHSNKLQNGGMMDNANPNNFLTEFDAGGSHEQNPLGGIPQGPNYNVEEGETKMGNYVYSDRLVVTPELIKAFNLPNNIKGKTFADASKKMNRINKESANDKIAKDTSQVMLARLQKASEAARMAEEMKQKGGFETGQPAMGSEPMFLGGGMSTGGGGNPMAALSGIMNMANQLGDSGIDTSGASGKMQQESVAGSSIGGALQGAQAGMSFGPWGAGIGAVLGGVTSGIGADKRNEERKQANINFDVAKNFQYSQAAALGGFIDSTDPTDPKKNKAQLMKDRQNAAMNDIHGDRTLNFGNYDKSYFDIHDQGINYVIRPSATNPQNAQGFKNQMRYLQSLNPNARFDFQYTRFDSRGQKANGGFLEPMPRAGGGFIDPPSKKAYLDEHLTGSSLDGSHLSNEVLLRNLNARNSRFAGMKQKPDWMLQRDAEFRQTYLQEAKKRKDIDYHEGKWRQLTPDQIKKYEKQYGENYNEMAYGGFLGIDPTDPMKDGMAYGEEQHFAEMDDIAAAQAIRGKAEPVSSITPSGIKETNGSVAGLNANPVGIAPQPQQFIQPQQEKQGFDWGRAGDIATGAMRYAPAITNALQLANMKKPEQESMERLNNRFRPDYADTQSAINRANESYRSAASALTNASNGSTGALRSNLLAAHLNRQKGLDNAFLQADNINRQQNTLGQQFNQRTDMTNLRQSNLEKDINARNRGAYDTNKSKLISALGTDIGNIGLEEMRKKYPERLGLLYDFLGKYAG